MKKSAGISKGAQIANNSRGSAMVESAIYFPIILLASMFIIYMMINMYSEASFHANLNKEVRAQSMNKTGNAEVVISKGKFTDKYRKAAELREISFSSDKERGSSYILGSGNHEMRGEVLTKYRKRKNEYAARAYCVSEKNYIW